MANFKYIDKKVILDLLEEYGISDEDIEEIYGEDNFIDYTKKLCDLYLKLLNENTNNSLNMAYSLGGIITFNLRKFVVKKDIIMLIGGTDANNENLRTTEIPLTELLNTPTNFSISDKALLLNSSLEKYENLNKYVNSQRATVWKKILNASQLTGKGDFITHNKPNGDYLLKTRDGEDRPLYQRVNIDRNVYYGYAGTNIYSYYLVDNKERPYTYFNRGWLFEHFMNKWMNSTSDEKREIIQEVDGEHPVSVAIEKPDNIKGYKGGDFRYKRKDYQAKYGNTQIITIKSIESVMKEIKKLLDDYKSEKRGAKRRFSEGLVKLFTHEDNLNLDQINKSYEEVVEKMTNSLMRRTKGKT